MMKINVCEVIIKNKMNENIIEKIREFVDS